MRELNVMNPTLAELATLAGDWRVEVIFPANPSNVVHGRMSLHWIEGGAFLVMRLDFDAKQALKPPTSASIIGRDDMSRAYQLLYFDERGVSRIYGMDFDGRIWKIWRAAPGFSQRFEGSVSADGRTIVARWEKCLDDVTWQHDFDITYRRVD